MLKRAVSREGNRGIEGKRGKGREKRGKGNGAKGRVFPIMSKFTVSLDAWCRLCFMAIATPLVSPRAVASYTFITVFA